MRVIDLSVCHKGSARNVIETLERGYGFSEGDWVKWSGNNPVVAKLKSRCLLFEDCWKLDCSNGTLHDSCSEKYLRHATQEEVRKAKMDIYLNGLQLPKFKIWGEHDHSIDFSMHNMFRSFGFPTNPFSKNISKPKFKDVQITKTEKIKINGKSRNVTIVVLNEGKKVKAGYSIRMPQDKANDELGDKIALGRAKNERTNLVDMELGKGLDRKFIMYAIAEDLLKQIERGVIKVKGVK